MWTVLWLLSGVATVLSCRFTLSPDRLFTSAAQLELRTTCQDCDIKFRKCFPLLKLRISGEWQQQDIVDWDGSGDCTKIGTIDMSPFPNMTQDVVLSITPQPCSPRYKPSQHTINSIIFQNMASSVVPVSSSQFSEQLASPLQPPDARTKLYPILGSSAEFLYWTPAQSVVVKLNGSETQLFTCSQGIQDSSPRIYSLSPNTLLALNDGSLRRIAFDGSNISVTDPGASYRCAKKAAPATIIPVPVAGCIRHVSTSADLLYKHLYVITEEQGKVYKVSHDMQITEESGILGAAGGCSGEIVDILSVGDRQIILLSSEVRSYYLVRDSGSSGPCTPFPDNVSEVAELSILENSTVQDATVLELEHLYSVQDSSPHVVGVGSVAVYSPCFGCAWYLLPVQHSPEKNYSVVVDGLGRYAIQTSTALYSCFYGTCTQIASNNEHSPLLHIVEGSVVQSFFSRDVNGTVEQRDVVHDISAVEAYNRATGQLVEGEQYEIRVELCASYSSVYTRQSVFSYHQPYKYQEECFTDNKIPEKVYLQRGESYSITATLSLYHNKPDGIDYLVSHSDMSVNVWDSSLVGVSIDKRVDYRKQQVVRNLTLTDMGQANRAPPGKKSRAVSVSVFPGQPGIVQPFHLVLGCKPGQKISLDTVAMSPKQILPESNEAVTYLKYDEDFVPSFKIVDLVSGNSTPYLGSFQLQIRGGGLNPLDIEPYRADELDLINRNRTARSVWIWPDDVDMLNASFKQIRWVCREQSPCSNVFPRWSGAPQYCFNIRFSNREANCAESYCLFEEDMTVCVLGLPLSMLQSLTSLTFFVLVSVCLVVGTFLKRHGWREVIEQVRCTKPDEENVEEAHARFMAERAAKQRGSRLSTTRRDRRSSIIADIRVMQGPQADLGSLAPMPRMAGLGPPSRRTSLVSQNETQQRRASWIKG